MAATRPTENEALRRLLRRVWRSDIRPLLRGRYAVQRRTAARVGGQVAASAGLMLDRLLGLPGRPFTRFLAVFGSTLGAILPDAWDWQWLRERARPRERRVVAEQVRRRAAELELADALGLFALKPTAPAGELRQAWRGLAQRWHPDRAPDAGRRAEYHVRFVAYAAAYARLRAAYERGELPVRGQDRESNVKN